MLYIALLRGINVGGHRIKMDRLRELFTELGFSNVRTYIQSGNVFFEDNESMDRATLTQTIEHHLSTALSYTVSVFLRTLPELEHIIALDPFKSLNVTSDMRLCITFTAAPLPEMLILPLSTPKGDMEIIHATDYEAFIVWHLINGRPPTGQGFKFLGNKNTTRFFHTTIKILEAAKNV